MNFIIINKRKMNSSRLSTRFSKRSKNDKRSNSLVFLIIAILAGLNIYILWRVQRNIHIYRDNLTIPEITELALLVLMTVTLVAIVAFYFKLAIKERNLALAETQRAQETQDELLSLASHQLRTPATTVKQYIGMMMEGYSGKIMPQQQKMLKKAYNSNERQLETINQILCITRADSGRLELQKSYFNLNQLIEEIITELSDTIKEKQQKVTFKPNFVNLPVYADQTCIRMIVENLLTNASKYTHPEGTICIKTNKKDNRVILSVTDNGVGIKSEDKGKLFKKFSRIDNELSITSGGSGIGLYLDKILVEMHDGKITVDSKPKKGTTFNVLLPVQASRAR
jgi:two-component system sensor histidine kinase ChiS